MTETTAPAEIIPATTTRPPPVAPQSTQGAPLTLFGTSDPAEVVIAATATAEALCEILEERKLYVDMGKGRRHVQIEGWALLGSMTGVFAHTVWTKEIADKTGKALGWEARAEATTLAGQIVGAAEAECRWAEEKWEGRDSYALKSMAQTRAQSKSLAMPLRFIVELAGFAGTPVEEMINGPATEETSYRCPACDGPLWDNRTKNDQREADDKKRMPEYKCKNTKCEANEGEPWITWNPNHFEDPLIKAKRHLVALVVGHKPAWKLYYPVDDPSYEDAERQLVAAIHEADDPTQMAGKLWADLTAVSPEDGDIEDTHLPIINMAAELILKRIGDDANDVLSPREAWETAAEKPPAENAVADGNDVDGSH